ncbi:WD40 repeat domain-containing protein [Mobilicoccus massiliensis]|uniref:hypothetical protein n=1 Tax=Mobilicoccus massiliensis TaxID=1522310 RepID=UPI00058B45A9|nr:hypothetical protein [Mobilicoccus massiliensis]
MSIHDSDVAVRIVSFVDSLPIPDAPPLPAATATAKVSRPHRGSSRPVWAGVAAAVAIGLLVLGAGMLGSSHRQPTPAGASSSLMPGRQWLGTGITDHPIGPVLIAAHIYSAVENFPLPNQTVLRDTTGDGIATAPTADGVVLVSPDGRHLAVGSRQAAKVTLIDTLDGASADVTVPSDADEAGPIGWSRDSSRVFVAGTRPAHEPASGLETGQVSTVDVATGTVRRFPQLDGATSVFPSPDDREVAAGIGRELRVMGASSGRLMRSIPAGPGVQFDHDAWSDDGRWIVGVTADRHQLVRFDAHTGERYHLPRSPGTFLGVTWANGRYLVRHISWGDAESSQAAVLRAVDVLTGEAVDVAHWDTDTITHDIPDDVSIARNDAGNFLR